MNAVNCEEKRGARHRKSGSKTSVVGDHNDEAVSAITKQEKDEREQKRAKRIMSKNSTDHGKQTKIAFPIKNKSASDSTVVTTTKRRVEDRASSTAAGGATKTRREESSAAKETATRTTRHPNHHEATTQAPKKTQQQPGFTLEEFRGDLFTSCGDTASLCHCVSRDFKMGAGIAVQFKKRFQRVHELQDQGAQIGQAAVIPRYKSNNNNDNAAFVYYLVTKERYHHKPTLLSVQRSCEWMRDHAVSHGVTCVAMPRIACGLDRLRWNDVMAMLVGVFGDTDIRLQVYSL